MKNNLTETQETVRNSDNVTEAERLQTTVLSLMRRVASRMADQILAERDAKHEAAETARRLKKT